ncbi:MULTISPECIES: TetR/AcrR family transcriptional regulator [Dyella]|uniref:TetR/AcrR family transcriptional regulator n=1 Tax=Dyella TaxID=231454 RepID=UPI000C85987B|nr:MULTISPECIES: TetR/AcrR family transcriptional regulator [Dyella]MDR3447846.1 TetR/AcrR family transcriptional regulator [Dyella sp.]PMQ03469.1 Transposon Tn10 TetC protein [Dyella sp. AD56]ULU24221.1 TetR/AcrR family transcriptional regulator [Dyella terrae]
MARKRLTREESRDQTHQRLLEAAALVIAKKGFAAASVEDITAQAGYTRGAFYSNFKSKAELFIELLSQDHQCVRQDLHQILDAPQSLEAIEEQITQYYLRVYRDEKNFILWAEARLLALRDAKFRARLNAYCLEKRDDIADVIERFYQMRGTKPPAPPKDLAFTTMALIDGMRFFNETIPKELSEEAAQNALGVIFTSTFFK